jgi:hypothetical protein
MLYLRLAVFACGSGRERSLDAPASETEIEWLEFLIVMRIGGRRNASLRHKA